MHAEQQYCMPDTPRKTHNNNNDNKRKRIPIVTLVTATLPLL